MSRLIDADALKSWIDCGHLRPPTELCFSELDVVQMLDKQPTISLNTLRDEIYHDAVAHGLWEGADYETAAQMGVEMYHAAYRIGDEVQELKDEAVRACNGKKQGYSEELSDVIIMALSIAGHFKIDIDADVRRKMAINKERPWKHGKEYV